MSKIVNCKTNSDEKTPYHIEKCICCGKEYKSTTNLRYRQRCEECIKEADDRYHKLSTDLAIIKLQIMHENAIKKIENCKQAYRFCDIQKAVSDIQELEEMSPESFNSASEIVAAIGLYYKGFFFKINHKVLNYSIDFYMPDDKICLEIDGGLHDVGNNRYRDGKRDVEIRNELGAEWEVVRIPTSYSDRFPFNIGNRALEIAEKQRDLRKKNHGHLPRGYSKSVDAYYAKIFD